MASILNTSILAYFLPVFIFIFIFAGIFALMQKTKIMGGNKTLDVAVALSLAVLAILSGQFIGLVSIVVPWVIFLFVGLFLVFALFGFFNVQNEKIWDLFGHTPIFVIILIIIIVGISIVFDTSLNPYTSTSQHTAEIMASASGSNVSVIQTKSTDTRAETIRTITNPRVLGAIFMLVIAAATMRYLGDKYTRT